MTNVVEQIKAMGKYITSPFGDRAGGSSGNTTYKSGMHRGVDIGGYAQGEPFRSPVKGTVVAAQRSNMGTWGNTICIVIEPLKTHVMLTAHHEKFFVKVGDKVEVGDPVAVVGGTTHVGKTYARHVHLEIQTYNGGIPWRGTPTNPATFWYKLEEDAPSSRFSAGNIIVSIATESVNIRSTPSTRAKIVGKLNHGNTVQVKDHKDNGIYAEQYYWWFIGTGWVAEPFFDLYLFPDPKPIIPPEFEDHKHSLDGMKGNNSLIEYVINYLKGMMK